MNKKTLLIFFGFLLLCVVINNIYTTTNSKPTTEPVNTVAMVDEREIVKELKEEYNNEEIVGYLRIPNTELKVPVTQSNDNSKYLSTDAYGNDDIKGNPFLDYRVDINNSRKLLIFGHNSKRYEAPFKILENYYDESFYNDHKYIELITDSNIFRYKIFSVFIETGDWSYMKLNNDIFEEMKKYKSKSFYDTGEDISLDDDILIIQTCAYKEEYLKYDKRYLLIVSRRVEE